MIEEAFRSAGSLFRVCCGSGKKHDFLNQGDSAKVLLLNGRTCGTVYTCSASLSRIPTRPAMRQ